MNILTRERDSMAVKKWAYIPPFMVGTFSDLEGFELFAVAWLAELGFKVLRL